MNRFQGVFNRCKDEGRAALMPYITGGDPSLETTERLIDELVANGADMIEIGMPYSDPLADGPTVQAAGQRALASGTTIKSLFHTVSRVRERHPHIPMALLIYYNCIFQYGERPFVRDAKKAGIDGIIVPDLPPEESDNLRKEAAEAGVCVIFLASPTSTKERLRIIAELSEGFIYCVSLTGVTGARHTVSSDLEAFLGRVRAGCFDAGKDLPLAVGFGISAPEHVERVAKSADGVIIGSALIDQLHSGDTVDNGIEACGKLMTTLSAALPCERND